MFLFSSQVTLVWKKKKLDSQKHQSKMQQVNRIDAIINMLLLLG